MSADFKPITIGLAGNPNCGKTTIFNALTGLNQHVGNYSGVTVEKKDGHFYHQGRQVNVVDLPGTYSLNYHSPEERIAQEEILSGRIDVIVAIVDSGTLARNLVFVTQLMQLGMPIILCLNMFDEVENAGIKIDIEQMKKLLGIPVIPTVGNKGRGLDTLRDTICSTKLERTTGDHLRLGDTADGFIKKIMAALPQSEQKNAMWTATKLLCNDAKYTEEITNTQGGKAAVNEAAQARDHIQKDTGIDIQLYITEQYYGFIDGLIKEVVTKTEARADARAKSDKIDKVLVHPIFGFFIFIGIIFVIFQLTFTLGSYPMDWLDMFWEWLSGLLEDNMSDTWLRSLLIDGIIGGVGGVISFLPNIIILFLGLSFLEDTGYMARCAFLMDKVMHKFGLHGRSFIPLITGFGCSVPGLMATRTIAGEKERLTTMMILPLMSCGARVPIWLLLIPCFFPEAYSGIAMMGIYLLGIIVALIAAVCLRKTLFKGEAEPFVMELPPYRMPTLRAVLMHMAERAWMYCKKAGTIILALSIILWALAFWHPKDFDEDTAKSDAIAVIEKNVDNNEMFAAVNAHVKEVSSLSLAEFIAQADEEAENAPEEAEENEEADENDEEAEETPWENLSADEKLAKAKEEALAARDNYVSDMDLQSSAIGIVGRTISPVFAPLGFDWKITTAVLGALAAKEVFVAQMGIVYSFGEADEESAELKDTLQKDYSLAQGLAMIVWLLISAPCIATLAVMKRESNSWKYALMQFLGLSLIAYILALITYQIAKLFM